MVGRVLPCCNVAPTNECDKRGSAKLPSSECKEKEKGVVVVVGLPTFPTVDKCASVVVGVVEEDLRLPAETDPLMLARERGRETLPSRMLSTLNRRGRWLLLCCVYGCVRVRVYKMHRARVTMRKGLGCEWRKRV